MEWHQLYFEMIYNYVYRQNERLIREIALRERMDHREMRKLLPSKRALREFTRRLPPHLPLDPSDSSDTKPRSSSAPHSPASGATLAVGTH